MKNGCSIDVFYYFVYSYTNLSLNLVHTSAVFSKCFASLTQETYKKCVFFFAFSFGGSFSKTCLILLVFKIILFYRFSVNYDHFFII